MARILLIDDDAALLDVLSLAFEDAGHAVLVAGDGLAGHRRIEADRPELVVSDVNMPGLDGFSLCRRLRGQGATIPFVLLTSRDDEIDEALGLELGADDYVRKPFSTRVLLARVAALLRREHHRSTSTKSTTVRHGDVELDVERLDVRFRGTAIPVTLTEFRLLEALVRRPGVVFSRDRLLELTRDDESFVGERIVDTYVRRLRRKFETLDADFVALETVIGAGYRWR